MKLKAPTLLEQQPDSVISFNHFESAYQATFDELESANLA
jgi:hypothetical protein